MNEILRFRRVATTAIHASVKSIFMVVLILCVVYPTTTVLSFTRALSAEANLPSVDSNYEQHKDVHSVNVDMYKGKNILAAQAKMMVELVPHARRDTESTFADYDRDTKHGKHGKHGRSGSEESNNAPVLELVPHVRRDTESIINDYLIASKHGKHGRSGFENSNNTPVLEHVRVPDAARDKIPRNPTDLKTRVDHHEGIAASSDIYVRIAQASGGGWGRQKPKPKPKPKDKNPPPEAIVKKDNSEHRPRTKLDEDTRESSRAIPKRGGVRNCDGGRRKCIHRPFFGPPAAAVMAREDKAKHAAPHLDDCSKGNHSPSCIDKGNNLLAMNLPVALHETGSEIPSVMSRKIPCHRCSPIGSGVGDHSTEAYEARGYRSNPTMRERQEAVSDLSSGTSSETQKTNNSAIADVMSYLQSHNSTMMSAGNSTNNATLPDNGNNKSEDNATRGVFYIVLSVAGFCMVLLGLIYLRHACIQRRRWKSLAERKTTYPYKPEASQIESLPRTRLHGSSRMKRIDEEVAEEPASTQPMALDGASDGWTRWLLQKRDTRKPIQMSPTPKIRPPRIPTLRLPQPTFSTVRKANGIKTETSMGHDTFKAKGRDGSKTKGTSMV
ncbi:uncharacterized protein LY89DRAFT_779106 [Mollisia scopiformis]|uniref:Uncharacterized protein n=1 Tax=Mollisia scopiformis TaxID=149040 RepID=A0A194XJL3_MOLSC|nr:uncharacterized protein LY89DRAFT_779106 [Mollisia scopiformis]KUJ20321.1 hypothetical protein LY89DRAFT_779106 [Mollisia scopiformis]